jgi:hypothetical protein
VWDSIWLPAVVVGYGVDLLRVRLAPGVTFNVGADKLFVRGPACGGKDTPRSCWVDEGAVTSYLKGHAWLAHFEEKKTGRSE